VKKGGAGWVYFTDAAAKNLKIGDERFIKAFPEALFSLPISLKGACPLWGEENGKRRRRWNGENESTGKKNEG
jgi:hypothetical protein